MSIATIRSVSKNTVALWATGAAIMGIGLITLLGWAADWPAVTTWRSRTVPMAPATAVLSLFFSTALLLETVRPARPRLARIANACGWAGLVVAFALLALRLTAVYWPIERLGLHPASDATVGFTSPITAACFVVINLTLLVTQSPWANRRGWLAIGASAGIAMTAVGLLVVAAFGPPMVFGTRIVPVALSTSVVLLLMGLGLFALAVRPFEERRSTRRSLWEGLTIYLMIYAAVGAVVLTVGYGYYRAEEVELRDQMQDELEVVADLKLRELTLWRAARMADARHVLTDGSLASGAARSEQKQADPVLLDRLAQSLRTLMAGGLEYDRGFLIDADGTTRLSIPEPAEPASDTLTRQAAGVLRSGQVTFLDFYVDERDRRPRLALLVPVAGGPPLNRPTAVIVLRIDPDKFLYPFLKVWPGTLASPETLLVRRDGDGVLFLNNLRFDPEAAMRRRALMTSRDVLAVQAVLGRTGLAEGVDYRGVVATGVLRPVPASPWYLVARMDIAERNGTLLERLWLVIVFSTIGLLAVGSSLALAWRVQQARFYRYQATSAAALRDSEERLRLALSAANQGLYDLNVQTGETIVSSEYATMLGYDPATFQETNAAWIDRLHPDDREPTAAAYRDYIGGRGADYRVEFRQRTSSGDWRWLLSVGRVVSRAEDGRPLRMLGTHTDITVRKLAELRAQRLSQLYAALSQCNEAIVRCTSGEELFPRICEAAVTQGGMAMAWVGLIDEVSSRVRPVAWFGAGTDYLTGIEISVDANSPMGRGPTGTAARENRPYWVDDFQRDPATQPWQARAEQFGWAGSVGLPLTRRGRPVGVLTFYAYDANAFDAEGRRLLTEMATDVSFALETFEGKAERVQAVEELQRALREKEALLREVHHRVKNNLQVITSMVRLESSRSTDAPVQAVLGDMKNRILSMALLHEMLYRSGHLAAVELSVYLAQLATQLLRALAPSSGRITLRLDLAPASVGFDDAISCGLLVNELIANAIKHAFPDDRSGEIAVLLQTVDAGPGLRITVADTGVGLPADFEPRRATSLGLQLVSDLARQLRGTVETGPGPGARFAVVFTPVLPLPAAEENAS